VSVRRRWCVCVCSSCARPASLSLARCVRPARQHAHHMPVKDKNTPSCVFVYTLIHLLIGQHNVILICVCVVVYCTCVCVELCLYSAHCNANACIHELNELEEEQLLTMDLLVLATMKNAANCETSCELHSS